MTRKPRQEPPQPPVWRRCRKSKAPPARGEATPHERHPYRRAVALLEMPTFRWASVRECPLSGLGGGQRALEGGPVGRPAVRREYVLHRQCEQRAQALGDLLARHARAEPPLVDLETPAEVDERVAGDHRTLALDPEHGVVRLMPGEHVGTERQPVTGRVRA